MSASRRNAAAVTLLLGLVLGSLGFFHAASADNPCDRWPDACAGNPGGGDQNSGAGGGGAASGGQPGTGNSPGGAAGNTSGAPSGNTSATGGQGGQGDSGTPGSNSTPTPIPTAPAAGLDSLGSSSSRSTGGTSASTNGSSAASDPQLVAWAKRFETTPDEVMSWFGTYTSSDSIGGEAPSVNLHSDDLVTISDHDVNRAPGDSGTTLLDPAKRDNGVATADRQRVDIAFHSTAVAIGSATTDTSGRFSATVAVPASMQSGKHFIIALAPKPNGGRAAFVFPLTIADRAAAAPAGVNQPGSAKRFPWLLFEAILGTFMVVGLFVVRVNTTVHR